MPGPPSSRLVVQTRRLEVERVLRAGEWNMDRALKLARKHGVALSRIQADRAAILSRWTDEDSLTLATDRARVLAEIRHTRQKAKAAGQFGASSSLLRLEAQILGLLIERVEVTGHIEVQAQERLAHTVIDLPADAVETLAIGAVQRLLPAAR